MMAWTGWYMATAWDFLFGLNRAVWNGLRWLYLCERSDKGRKGRIIIRMTSMDY